MNINHIKFLVLLVLLFSLASCYGPIYKKPTVNKPVQWYSSDPLSQMSDVNMPMLAWWERFNDPQLSYLISTALKNNNNIQAAVGNVVAAQGQLEAIELSWVPNVSTLFGYTNININGLDPGFNAGFMPSYAFNLFQFIRSREYAEANLAAVNAAKDAVRLTVIGQTAGSYFSYLGQSYLLQLQTQLVEDLKNLLSLSKMQYEKGLISLFALQQYEQQYDLATANLPVVQQNVVVSRNALRLLLNKNPGPIAKGKSFVDLKSSNIIPVNLPSQVLKNRPDVRQAEQQLIAANANVGIAESTFFPSINLVGAAGSVSNHLGGLFGANTDFWHYQATTTMPTLSLSTLGQIKQSKGQYYAAYSNYIQTVRIAFQSVDNDLSAHSKYSTSLTQQNKNYESSRKAYDLAYISFEKGLYSYPVVLQNKVTMDYARIYWAQTKLAELNTIVQLYQDLGGGYKVSSAKQHKDKS